MGKDPFASNGYAGGGGGQLTSINHAQQLLSEGQIVTHLPPDEVVIFPHQPHAPKGYWPLIAITMGDPAGEARDNC